jgi:P-type Ca2+ transporter type 2C
MSRHGSFFVPSSTRHPYPRTRSATSRVHGRTARVGAEPTLVEEYPLTARRLAVAQAWRFQEGLGLRIAAKGASEAIADLCQLSDRDRDALTSRVTALAASGWRVLGVAEASWPE